MISVGLIGCGDVAEFGHLPTILQHRRFRLAAVCDVNRSRAELLSARAGGVPAYADWRTLLMREQLDAAVLALPPEVSPVVVAECLDRHLAVLDEKPLAVSVAEGRRIEQLVNGNSSIYQVGFVLRYGAWVDEIRKLSVLLGRPLRFRAEIFDELLDLTNVAHFARIQGFLANSTALTHEGSHVVDYVSVWNSEPWEKVSARAERTSPILAGPNIWDTRIDLADSSTIDLKIAWLLPELPPSKIYIEGPEGRLSFNFITGKCNYEIQGSRNSIALGPTKPEWLRQYDAFADAIESGHVKVATVNDALRSLEVTAACELSAALGRSVTRTEFQRGDAMERIDNRHYLPASPTTSRTVIAQRATEAG